MYLLNIELKDFSAAHRLVKNYHGKCNHLHGHNYALKITLAANALSAEQDLVIDFSVARAVCNKWVQTHIDHSTLVFEQDKPLVDFLKKEKQKHFLMRYNTTVECLAKAIYENLTSALITECEGDYCLQQVEVHESRECSVIYSGEKSLQSGVRCGE